MAGLWGWSKPTLWCKSYHPMLVCVTIHIFLTCNSCHTTFIAWNCSLAASNLPITAGDKISAAQIQNYFEEASGKRTGANGLGRSGARWKRACTKKAWTICRRWRVLFCNFYCFLIYILGWFTSVFTNIYRPFYTCRCSNPREVFVLDVGACLRWLEWQ